MELLLEAHEKQEEEHLWCAHVGCVLLRRRPSPSATFTRRLPPSPAFAHLLPPCLAFPRPPRYVDACFFVGFYAAFLLEKMTAAD